MVKYRGFAIFRRLFYNSDMLEQLFGSHTRVKLLRLFLANPQQAFFVRELSRLTNSQINSIRRELANLMGIDFLTSFNKDFKRYYQVNPQFLLYTELKSLILKSRLASERKFLTAIKEIGVLQYLMLTGYFVDDPEAPVDMLIVGSVNRKKLQVLLEKFGDSFGQKIRFTAMDLKEYNYRKEITDKFLYDLLTRKKIIVLDKINKVC